MKPSDIAHALRVCIDLNIPAFVWGPPGVGKSDTMRQVAKADGLELIDMRANLRDPVDVMGLPYAKDGRTFYNAPADLPTHPDWRGLIFLDELNTAPPQTQAAYYQLTLDRAVGSYKLPKGARIVAAGNRVSDRGVVHRMPDPLADRFVHLDFETELNDWCTWALANNIAAEVVAFMRFRPEFLQHKDEQRKSVAFATPRGWGDVSKFLAAKSPVESALIRGRVGDAVAGEFIAFLKIFRSMVPPDAVLRNPLTADVPTKPDILYALSEALARRATDKTADAVLTYAARLPKEYAAVLVSSATARDPQLCNVPEFQRWFSQHP